MEALVAALKQELIKNGVETLNDITLTRIAQNAAKTAKFNIVPPVPGGNRIFAVPLPHLGGDPRFWHYLNQSNEWRPMAPIHFEMDTHKPTKVA